MILCILEFPFIDNLPILFSFLTEGLNVNNTMISLHVYLKFGINEPIKTQGNIFILFISLFDACKIRHKFLATM